MGADALATLLKQPLTEETQKILNNFIDKATNKINSFYSQANQLLHLCQQSENDQDINFSVFDKMKAAQIESFDISQELIKFRQSIQKSSEKNKLLNNINQLVGEGYKLLAELGEEFNGIGPVSYVIYNYNGKVLKQATYNLDEFVKTLRLGASNKGNIYLAGVTHFRDMEESPLSNLYRDVLPKYEDLRKEMYNEYMYRYDSIVHYMAWHNLKFFGLTDKEIEKLENGMSMQQMAQQSVASTLTYGRLLEWVAYIHNQQIDHPIRRPFSERAYLFEHIVRDKKPFYQGEDFNLIIETANHQRQEIAIQAKMRNGGQKLSTITNGLTELANILYKYQNQLPQQVGEKGEKSANGVTQKALEDISQDLLKMFVSSS